MANKVLSSLVYPDGLRPVRRAQLVLSAQHGGTSKHVNISVRVALVEERQFASVM